MTRDELQQINLPQELPISEREDEIVRAIQANQVVIIRGETGSGKTTQIPKLCLKALAQTAAPVGGTRNKEVEQGKVQSAKSQGIDEGLTASHRCAATGRIKKLGAGRSPLDSRRPLVVACTQPRRVAAMAVGNRIAEELGEVGKRIVGTKIRFTDHTSKDTRIKVMTDGILLNEMQRDPLLRQYAVIVVDEAHERSLNIDFILGHLIQIRKKRRDLKIIITSATIDTQQFSEAFGGAPVIEVTGRMFPVEVRYRDYTEAETGPFDNSQAKLRAGPFDNSQAKLRAGDFTYIEACYDAVEEIVATSRNGDLLVFLPAEKDIRELCGRLNDDFGRRFEIVPLFGRLSQADQQRIFRTNQKRKIVVATNIAETSITVPGIRYVIDSGLARISRYSSHTRTQRLPIEPISQSSANQRKGRCGRVAEGICIRLYSEEDFNNRPEFTPPEIFRSNLASVILRLKAFKFGEVESFPFMDPPESRALQGGMILLKELRAVDDSGELTQLGRKLARLPIDPTVGRMLLEAEKLNVQRSVLIIASAISIQDPRERPLEKEKLASKEHQRFQVKGSDFLSLLQIWRDFDEKYEKWSQSKMRKFCRDHFISYQRLREWREIHQQIRGVLRDLKVYRESKGEEESDLIHRSILTGLIGNVAFKEDGNWYQATRGRKVMVFPGSVMFQKQEKTKKQKTEAKPKPKAPAKKEWIMAAEFVETSRLFARSVARVEEGWIREAGAHLINYSYQEPHWSTKSQRVLAWKKEFLYGLQIARSRASYGEVDAKLSKEIFIQSGILERGIRDRFSFLEHNQKLQDEVIELQTRLRRSLSLDLDYKLYQFYDRNLPEISSVAELHKWWRSLDDVGQKKLFLSQGDLMDQRVAEQEKAAFPEKINLGDGFRKIDYRYRPGEQNDGATLSVPLSQFASIQEGSLDWMIPGYVEDKVEQLIRSLPKDYRRHLSPVKDKSKEIMAILKPSPSSLLEDLTKVIHDLYGLKIPGRAWDLSAVPQHLRLKIQLVDNESGEVIIHSDDWDELSNKAEAALKEKGVSHSQHTQVKIWKEACSKWERNDLKDWHFGDLPQSLQLGEVHGVPLMAYPGLVLNTQGEVGVRLFRKREEAVRYTVAGYRRLAEMAVGREIGWFLRDLKQLKNEYLLFSDNYVWDDFRTDLEQLVMGSLFAEKLEWPLLQHEFEQRVEYGKQRLRGMRYELSDLLAEVGKLRLELLNGPLAKHPHTKQILARLLPNRFVRIYNLQRFQQLPRYLKAHQLRLKRAANHPRKDAEKAERIQVFLKQYVALMKTAPKGNAQLLGMLRDLFFALEEFRVSVFAQELGTHGKVSEKVLEAMVAEIKDVLEASGAQIAHGG